MSTQRVGAAPGASRALVLAVLRASSRPLAIEAMATEVGLSVNTVRFHLDRLRREGLVTRDTTLPAGPGRPHQVFRAVAAEVVDDDAAYRLLARLLADGLFRTGDVSATVEAGRAWADQVGAAQDVSAGGATTHDADRAAVSRVVELFEDGGFAPQVLDSSTIALGRCPFRELAAVRAEVVCTLHLGFVRGALQHARDLAATSGRVPHGLDVDRARLTPILDGSGPCLLSLPNTRDRPRTP